MGNTGFHLRGGGRLSNQLQQYKDMPGGKALKHWCSCAYFNIDFFRLFEGVRAKS